MAEQSIDPSIIEAQVNEYAHRYFKKLEFDSKADLQTSILGMGENNLNLMVQGGNKKIVFRIALRDAIEENMIKEFEALKEIPSGMGPKGILIDTSRTEISFNFLVESYVEGTPRTQWSEELLSIHGRKLAELHNIRRSTNSKFGSSFSLLRRLDHEINSFREESIVEGTVPFLQEIRSEIEEHDGMFTNLREFSRIHGDLTPGNILISNKQPHYIDWEWSCYGDNAFDLAKLYYKEISLLDWALQLDEEHESVLLTAYQEGLGFKDSTLKERIHLWQLYILFTDYLYFRWKVEQYHNQPSEYPLDYYKKTVSLMEEALTSRYPTRD